MFVRSYVYDPDNPFTILEEIIRIKPCYLRRYKEQVKRDSKSYKFNAKVNFIVYEEMEDYEDEV